VSAIGTLPQDWREALGPAASNSVLATLEGKVAAERAKGDVYPAAEDVFAAFRLTPYRAVRAVIIGQDPYHGPGEAHGLAFSVPRGLKKPPSLQNILSERHADLALPIPTSGSLERWAESGVLLLNAILTVTRDQPASHRRLGWQPLTKAVVEAVQDLDHPVAFLLWGVFARRMAGPIDATRHIALYASHPSGFSARKGFLGSRPFSTANAHLEARGAAAIDWRLEPE
jgi:uracil-DNA glycosylase